MCLNRLQVRSPPEWVAAHLATIRSPITLWSNDRTIEYD
jgi:hypothetical protein